MVEGSVFGILEWCADSALKEAFHNLYMIVEDNDAFVYSFLETSDDERAHSWNLIFVWAFHDWKLNQLICFLISLSSNLPVK